MKSTAWLLLLLVCGAAGWPAAARPPATPAEAQAEAEQLLSAAKITSDWQIDAAAAVRARRVGLDEARALRLVRSLLAACLSKAQRCEAFDLLKGKKTHPIKLAVRLIAVLGEIGTRLSLPFLTQLDARGMYQADMARERIFTRAMARRLAGRPCSPPTTDEIAAARRSLTGFLVLRWRAGRLSAERPAAAEMDDLAYFLAASAGAGPEVGRATEQGRGSPFKAAPLNPAREQQLRAFDAAKLRGNLAAVVRDGRAVLVSLGYPGPIRTEAEHQYAWGGARYSYVMRDVATAAEAIGELKEAAHLYRRANPGGGACGTSVSVRWQDQVRGTIRTEEQLSGCRSVVPERLLEIDDSEGNPYGTARLKAAGFDLLRLFRGALVTLNRDVDPTELRRRLDSVKDGSLRRLALERLQRLGAEDWERRVHALEGLADIGQRAALPLLLVSLEASHGQAKIRAVAAIAKLAERPDYDPCDPTIIGGMGESSSEWNRPIRPLGRSCRTKLSAAATAALAKKILPQLGDAEPEVREAAAEALGSIGSPAARRALRRLLVDRYSAGGQICTSASGGKQTCRPHYPIQEAARKALARIEGLERRSPAR